MTVLIGEPALRMLHAPVTPRDSGPLRPNPIASRSARSACGPADRTDSDLRFTLSVVDSEHGPTTSRALNESADSDLCLTTTAEICQSATGPYTNPPLSVR
jgi:hypothetical protein